MILSLTQQLSPLLFPPSHQYTLFHSSHFSTTNHKINSRLSPLKWQSTTTPLTSFLRPSCPSIPCRYWSVIELNALWPVIFLIINLITIICASIPDDWRLELDHDQALHEPGQVGRPHQCRLHETCRAGTPHPSHRPQRPQQLTSPGHDDRYQINQYHR